ncbi:aldo/keto reductase [Geovibrio thiophilus]|uniref:Aldo/keto reductase n=1 Tax=Geovibrio thiophilus TaxID=139438 RepID=A0A3R5UTV7_9BACT|nr:aldo/keto reductase [Geovibrio thiophilus]QAR32347.1 aldo/keto reductase [Geovibrio thiophilus]
MEYRKLAGTGLSVPVFSFGTATFGGEGDFFKAWGNTDVQGAKRLVDICLEHGINFFDTANTYSRGASERILGDAVKGRRGGLILSTKSTFPMGDGPNDCGSFRANIIKELEGSLKRLGTDYVDIYFMHGFDATTPVEETLRTLDDMITAGKIRCIGCSNFSGWHLMKSLSASEKHGWSRYIFHQVYYSLVGREYEWELMPLALDQKVSAMVWSPLAGGALSGKINRKTPPKEGSRSAAMDFVISSESEYLFKAVDALYEVAEETGRTVPQVALNWVINRPSVANVIIGARNEQQLLDNLGAAGWKLTDEQVAKLDAATNTKPVYPYWHQNQFPMLVPSPLKK